MWKIRRIKMIYKPGDHVLYKGKEMVVINKHPMSDTYTLDNGKEVRIWDLERIEDYDYNKPLEEINEGDWVIVTASASGKRYDGLYFNSTMLKYLNKIARVTDLKGYEGFYLDISGSRWVWNELMVKRITLKNVNVGDVVSYNNGIHRITRIPEVISGDDVYMIDDKIIVSRRELTLLDEVKIKLRRDVFGIGSKGDILTAFRTEFTDTIIVDTDKMFFGEVDNDEYELLE
jgi:hypothetical protein